MQVQLHGGKHRGQKKHNPKWNERAKSELGSNVDRRWSYCPLLPARDPVLLRDWADYLDCCRFTDKEVGAVLARWRPKPCSKKRSFCSRPITASVTRGGKQFLYDEGIHVPLIVRGPGIGKGIVRDDPVELIDLAAISLAAAGVGVPAWDAGRDVFAPGYVGRDAVFAARDRCDETMERIRSVRTTRFKYIRNSHPSGRTCNRAPTKTRSPSCKHFGNCTRRGRFPKLSEKLLFAETRPPEELYDLHADPFETRRNLAADPAHAETLAGLRRRLSEWESHTADRGASPNRWKCTTRTWPSTSRGNPVCAQGRRNPAAEHRAQQEWAAAEGGEALRPASLVRRGGFLGAGLLSFCGRGTGSAGTLRPTVPPMSLAGRNRHAPWRGCDARGGTLGRGRRRPVHHQEANENATRATRRTTPRPVPPRSLPEPILRRHEATNATAGDEHRRGMWSVQRRIAVTLEEEIPGDSRLDIDLRARRENPSATCRTQCDRGSSAPAVREQPCLVHRYRNRPTCEWSTARIGARVLGRWRADRVALRIVVQFGVRELGRRDLFQHLEGRRADTVEEQVECGGFRGAESVKNRDE